MAAYIKISVPLFLMIRLSYLTVNYNSKEENSYLFAIAACAAASLAIGTRNGEQDT